MVRIFPVFETAIWIDFDSRRVTYWLPTFISYEIFIRIGFVLCVTACA